MNKQQRQIIDSVFILIGTVMTIALLAVGGLSWWAYRFATTSVHSELVAQKIYFPPKGSPALDPTEFPDLQQYAGQQVDNGPKAKAYANGFINRHLQKVADGKTYAEVSTLAQQDPTSTQLQQEKQTLFQGETLRGLLLGDGYSYWTFGTIAKYAALVSFVSAGAMAILVWLGMIHLLRR